VQDLTRTVFLKDTQTNCSEFMLVLKLSVYVQLRNSWSVAPKNLLYDKTEVIYFKIKRFNISNQTAGSTE
jgi:hypothetical protein